MNLVFIPRLTAVACLRVYQQTLSFDHGPLRWLKPYGHCRFHPSCSEYACQALLRHGFLRGGGMSLWRVLRCHPWSAGGIDQVK